MRNYVKGLFDYNQPLRAMFCAEKMSLTMKTPLLIPLGLLQIGVRDGCEVDEDGGARVRVK